MNFETGGPVEIEISQITGRPIRSAADLTIAAPRVLGEPRILHGEAAARIRELDFQNLTVSGTQVSGPEFFETNEFVEDLHFQPAP